MKSYRKKDFPVSEIRRYLEPGPVVLVSSRYGDETDIMTLGWHTVLEFTPSLIGCVIASTNHSFSLIEQSRECVINIPTVDMARKVMGIGNSTGGKLDKFAEFQLTAVEGTHVKAPLIKECYANLECKLAETALMKNYNFFIFEVVKAHVATSPRYPRTLHYRGDGIFMVSGEKLDLSRFFMPGML